MREIKFRAWGKELGMSETFTLKEIDGSDVHEFDVYMQYTGLKDKNGKEIYEGDIIIIKRDISEVTGHDGISTIVWEDGAFYAQGDNHCNLAGKYLEYSEIIGNIYEKNN